MEDQLKPRIQPFVDKIKSILTSIDKKEKERIVLQLAYDQLVSDLKKKLQNPQQKSGLDQLLKDTQKQGEKQSNKVEPTQKKPSEKVEVIKEDKNKKTQIPDGQQNKSTKKLEQQDKNGDKSKAKKKGDGKVTKDNQVSKEEDHQEEDQDPNEEDQDPNQNSDQVETQQANQQTSQKKQSIEPNEKYKEDLLLRILGYLHWGEVATLRILNKNYQQLVIKYLQNIYSETQETLAKYEDQEKLKENFKMKFQENFQIVESLKNLQSTIQKININEKNLLSSLQTFLLLIGFNAKDEQNIQNYLKNQVELIIVRFFEFDKSQVQKSQKTALGKFLKETDLSQLHKQNDQIYVIGKFLFNLYTSMMAGQKQEETQEQFQQFKNYNKLLILKKILRIKEEIKEIEEKKEEQIGVETQANQQSDEDNDINDTSPEHKQQVTEQQQEKEQEAIQQQPKVSSQIVTLDPSIQIKPNQKYKKEIFLTLFDFISVEDLLNFTVLNQDYFKFFKENCQEVIDYLIQRQRKNLKSNSKIINLMVHEGIVMVTRNVLLQKIDASGLSVLKGMLNPPEQLENVVKAFAKVVNAKSSDFKNAIKSLSYHSSYEKYLKNFKYFYLTSSHINLLIQLKNNGSLKLTSLNEMDKTVGQMGQFLLEIVNQKSKEENNQVENQIIKDYWLAQYVVKQYEIQRQYKRITSNDNQQQYLIPKGEKNLLSLLSGKRIFKNIFDCLHQKEIFPLRQTSKKFNDEVLQYVRDNTFSELVKISENTFISQEQISQYQESQEKSEEQWEEQKTLLEEINPKDFTSLLSTKDQKPEIKGLISNIAKLLGMKKTSWEGLQEDFDFAEFMKRAEELDLKTLNQNKNFSTVNNFIMENSIQKLTKANITARFIALWFHKLFEATRNYPYDQVEQHQKNEFTKKKIDSLEGILKKYNK